MKDIDSIIMILAGDPSKVGYKYLKMCVEDVIKNGFPYNGIMRLYKKIGKACGVKGDVSREVARAVVDCYDNGNRKLMSEIVGFELKDKIDPKQFILYFATYVKQEEAVLK